MYVFICIYIYIYAPVCDWVVGEHLGCAIRGGCAQFIRDPEVGRRSDSVSINVKSYIDINRGLCVYLFSFILYIHIYIYIYIFAAPVCDWVVGEHLGCAIRGGCAQFIRDSEVSGRSDSVSIYVKSYICMYVYVCIYMYIYIYICASLRLGCG